MLRLWVVGAPSRARRHAVGDPVGLGLLDATTGAKIARDRDRDPQVATPDGPDLARPGIGVLTGTRVMIAGLFGSGLHATTADG